MCNKYNTYAIEVVHMNGNRMIKEANNTNSYNNTMSLYRKVKDDYMNENVTINFVGFTEEDEQGVIFTKRNTTVIEERRNIEDLILCIAEATEQLQDQFEQVNDKIGYYDKKKSNIEHLMIEGADVDSLTEKDKAKVFNDLRKISLLRRDYKILQSLRDVTKVDLGQMVKLSSNILDKYNKTVERSSDLNDKIIKRESGAIDKHLIKKIPYKDHKERIAIMSMIEKKYDKVVNLEDEKVLACYNTCTKRFNSR